jgi:phospholipase C
LPAAPEGALRTVAAATPGNKIQHVIFIVQENRTVDNIFGGPNPFPNADVVSSGQTLTGTVPLQPVSLGGGDDPNNFHGAWLAACNPTSGPPFTVGAASPCRMNGFNVAASPAPNYTPPASMEYLYSYVKYSDTAPYWDIAKKYELGDHFFMGHNSESYTAHQYIFSGQSNNTVDAPIYPSTLNCGALYAFCVYTPWGCDSPAVTTMNVLNPMTGVESPSKISPCFGPGTALPMVHYPSLADLVGAKGLTWRLYAHSLCSNINGLDVNGSTRYSSAWPTTVNMSKCHTTSESFFPTKVDTPHFRVPSKTFLTDVAGANGTLANVTWILPGPLSSDHPGVPLGSCGPGWVANIINAVGNSKYWNSTVIFVFWDDWAGFYDHVPPYVVRDQEGPGFRVPLLVVSPYAHRGIVAHTNVEFASLLKFTEQNFNLGSLGATDTSPYLNNLNAFFDFSVARPFVSITTPSFSHCSFLESQHRAPSKSRWLKMVNDDD